MTSQMHPDRTCPNDGSALSLEFDDGGVGAGHWTCHCGYTRDLYYELIDAPHSATGVILQEFPHSHQLGVALLRFGTEEDAEIAALGGVRIPAHYGPTVLSEHLVEDSWLFPLEHRERVKALVLRVVQAIEARAASEEAAAEKGADNAPPYHL